MKQRNFIILAFVLCLFLAHDEALAKKSIIEKDAISDFVDIKDVEPSIIVEMRYFTPHNFVGEKIRGYETPKCLLTKEAAKALADAQAELKSFSLSFKIYDCYRPQRAVDHFVEWAKDLNNTKMKKEFYPTVEKSSLFSSGYIASKSGHSRGSTVDLTIIPMPRPKEAEYKSGDPLHECYLPEGRRFKDAGIDMGTGFDCFSELSHTTNPKIGLKQRINRMLLKTIMEKHGFVNYDKEWWHYTLKDEPFPKTFFDFPIE